MAVVAVLCRAVDIRSPRLCVHHPELLAANTEISFRGPEWPAPQWGNVSVPQLTAILLQVQN